MQEYKHRLVLNLHVDDGLRKPGRILMRLYFVMSNLLLEKARQKEDTGERSRRTANPACLNVATVDMKINKDLQEETFLL